MAHSATEIPTSIPSKWVKGDTIKWITEVADHEPGDGWSLTYAFVKSDAQFTVDSSDNGDGRHLLALTPAESGALTAGKYTWQLKLKKGSDEYTIERSVEPIEVLTEFEGATSGYDARTVAETNLDAIEALLAGKPDVASFEIAGRSLSRFTHTELIAARDYWRKEVARERAAAAVAQGKPTSRLVRVRLS